MLNEKGNVELQAKIKFARHNGAQGPVSRKPLKLQRPEKFPGLSRNEPQAPVKIVLLSDFHGEFHEVRASPCKKAIKRKTDSYYLLYIITNNENYYIS